MSRTQQTEATARPSTRWWRKRGLQWTAGMAVVCLTAAGLFIRHVELNAEPVLRQRIIETVARRFNAPVSLGRVEISAFNGLEVTGEDLRVEHIADPSRPAIDPTPLVSVRRFQFRTDFFALLRSSTSVGVVYVSGMELHIPPFERHGPRLPDGLRQSPRLPIVVNHVICDDAKLFIDTSKPGKDPLEFDIQHLDLSGVDWQKAFRYDAILTNPKPTGLIHAVGSFGPWQVGEPRETPVDGNYNFSHADLNTIKGIGGMLSSSGHFAGQLDRIAVDGATDTPDFSLDTSNHPVPLHTNFHAIVDGTNGDTQLDPVRARMLHSEFTARGTITRVGHEGHDIDLIVDMPNARIEDMLQLAVKTQPLMRGALSLHTWLHIPPGPARVPQKLELNGHFDIRHVSFTNPATQHKIDGLSLLAQGRPEEAAQVSGDRAAEVSSEMQAGFVLSHAMATVHDLNYRIPGALVRLNGVYSLNGDIFEFRGHVRTAATASQMTTGWKSFILQAVDPFLRKDGAGLELPVSISGSNGDVHFSVSLLGGGDESTGEMKQDLKDRAEARRERQREAKIDKQQEEIDRKRNEP